MNYEILVNKDNKMVDNDNLKLVKIFTNYKDKEMFLEEKTYEQFLKMKNEASNLGYEIDIESAYRTHEYQQKLFDDLVIEKGLEYAKTHVAVPHTSEHETGLAIDFCIYKNNKFIDEYDIEDLEETSWLHNNCHKYGFILRYPRDKEDITKYSYEPWHIRYVGNNLAKYLYKNNLTLEEYYNNK
ncbi:MAG: M15 family metallopeptidase [Bacilli bacterium]|nr:M15 family metallopeptidase [Bacilli bacterium]